MRELDGSTPTSSSWPQPAAGATLFGEGSRPWSTGWCSPWAAQNTISAEVVGAMGGELRAPGRSRLKGERYVRGLPRRLPAPFDHQWAAIVRLVGRC